MKTLLLYLARFLRLAVLLGCPLSDSVAWGQMTTGSAMEDFDKTFNLSAKGWSVQQIGCSRGANVLWPGEDVTFTFFVKPAQPYKGRLKVDVIRYGTKGKPGDWWKPVVFKLAETSSTEVGVALPGGRGQLRGYSEDRAGVWRLCRHPQSGGRWAGLRLHVRARASRGARPRTASDLCHGPGLAARALAPGL